MPTGVFFNFNVPANVASIGGAELIVTLTYNFATVPEPATWAMMIAGFGAVGAIARTRRRQLEVPAFR